MVIHRFHTPSLTCSIHSAFVIAVVAIIAFANMNRNLHSERVISSTLTEGTEIAAPVERLQSGDKCFGHVWLSPQPANTNNAFCTQQKHTKFCRSIQYMVEYICVKFGEILVRIERGRG